MSILPSSALYPHAGLFPASFASVVLYVHAMTPLSAINEYVGGAVQPTWAASGVEPASYVGDGTLV